MSVTIYSTSPANCLPCCNANLNAAAVSCRTIGGTASLCGISEYTNPSTPPKKYRTETLTGSFCGLNWAPTAAMCGGGSATDSGNLQQPAGAYQVNATTCAVVNTQVIKTITNPSNPPTCAGTPVGNEGGFSSAPFITRNSGAIDPVGWPIPAVQTQTHQDFIYTGACEFHMSPDFYRSTSGDAISDLTDEDTDTDATSRLKATANYTNWTPVGDGSGGTCVPSSCCKSVYQSRSNFVFAYVESQYRANVQAANSTSYSLIAEVWRAPYPFSNYALFSYQLGSFTTNSTGFASTVMNVPITKGYSTYVANVEYY